MQLVGETATRERTGAASASVRYHSHTWEAEIPLSFRGLIYQKSEKAQQEDGTFIITATYEGVLASVDGGGNGGINTDRDPNAVYEWSPSFEQTSITKHPDIEYLLERYNGTVDEASDSVIWPKELTYDAGDGQSETRRNPMFGVTNYLSPGGIWSETKVQSSLPQDVFSSIGTVLQTDPPGGISAPYNRFWLVMPPEISEQGDQWKVTRRWMLSGKANDEDIEAARDIYSGLI